jgi:hypothetical protein
MRAWISPPNRSAATGGVVIGFLVLAHLGAGAMMCSFAATRLRSW